jgi:hypothetical protein
MKGLLVKQRVRAAYLIVIFSFLSLVMGCVSVDPPGSLARRFFDTIDRYPPSRQQLAIEQLSGRSFSRIRNAGTLPDVHIIVHPAYALFFRDAKRSKYADVKYELLIRQFEEEERFIREAARAGKIVILIIPGGYEIEMQAPETYTAYLNAVTGGGNSIFYLYSESLSNGTIPTSEMVELYRFLQNVKVRRVLIGGGYIGRCQREFYNELTAYYETTRSYIVPEISTVSPEDISDEEAAAMLDGIERRDYSPVRKFIEKKLDRSPNVLFAPA